MKPIIIFLFFTLIASISAHAVQYKDPHHKGVWSSLNVGTRFSSLIQNRGVIFYRDYQFDPVVGLFFFDDRLEYLGDSLGYRDFIAGDWLRLRSRFVAISDNPLFPVNKTIQDSGLNRKDTYEWTNTLEFFLPGYNSNYQTEIDLSYAKDISQTHGNYFELQAKHKLFYFEVPKAEIKIEPNIFGLVGWGDKDHNKYFYGESANTSGVNNIAYGLWFAFPEESDRFYPIIQIRRFQTLGEFRNAEFAKGRNEGFLLSFIATYGVLE